VSAGPWVYHVSFAFSTARATGGGDFLFESPGPVRSSGGRAPVMAAVLARLEAGGACLVGMPVITSLTLVWWPALGAV